MVRHCPWEMCATPGACIKPGCLVRRPLCHKVNLPSSVARRPLCHKVNLPSCVVRRPLCHKVNLPSCVARRPLCHKRTWIKAWISLIRIGAKITYEWPRVTTSDHVACEQAHLWVGYRWQRSWREEWGEEKWACTRAIDFWIPRVRWRTQRSDWLKLTDYRNQYKLTIFHITRTVGRLCSRSVPQAFD